MYIPLCRNGQVWRKIVFWWKNCRQQKEMKMRSISGSIDLLANCSWNLCNKNQGTFCVIFSRAILALLSLHDFTERLLFSTKKNPTHHIINKEPSTVDRRECVILICCFFLNRKSIGGAPVLLIEPSVSYLLSMHNFDYGLLFLLWTKNRSIVFHVFYGDWAVNGYSAMFNSPWLH